MSSAEQRCIQYILKRPRLKKDEQRALFCRWHDQGDKEAREKLITSYLQLIVPIARRYCKHNEDIIDLINEGVLALMHVIDRQGERKFDPEKGSLAGIAAWWIRSYISESVYRDSSIVKGPCPSNARTRRAAGTENKRPYLPHPAVSLDAPLSNDPDETGTFLDFLVSYEDTEGGTELLIAERLDAEKTTEVLEEALSMLTKREEYVIRERVYSDEKKTLEVLSDELGISKERVRQIEMEAFDHMREYLDRWHRPLFEAEHYV